MLKNKFATFGLVAAGLMPSVFGSNVIQDAFIKFGTTITKLIMNEKVVLGFMFFAMLVGTFALFKGLLRFSFAKADGSNTFGQKEINVIALMLAIIGTTGIFFIFRTDASGLISLFGGTVGLLFVLFICILIMKYFTDFAKSFENPDGPLGKGAGWISIVVLGAIFCLFLLVGYAGQVLKSLGCRVASATGNVSCTSLSDYNIFLVIYNNGSTILTWLVFFAVIFGLMALKKKPEDEPEPVVSKSGSDEGFFGRLFGKKKEKEKSPEDKEFDKQVKELKTHVDDVKRGLGEVVKSINKQKELLTKAQKKFGEMDNKGGKN